MITRPTPPAIRMFSSRGRGGRVRTFAEVARAALLSPRDRVDACRERRGGRGAARLAQAGVGCGPAPPYRLRRCPARRHRLAAFRDRFGARVVGGHRGGSRSARSGRPRRRGIVRPRRRAHPATAACARSEALPDASVRRPSRARRHASMGAARRCRGDRRRNNRPARNFHVEKTRAPGLEPARTSFPTTARSRRRERVFGVCDEPIVR